MREVDGFTLIDYIKSSIEILMNMKIEEGNEGVNPLDQRLEDPDYDELDEQEERERRRKKKEKKEAKKKKLAGDEAATGMAKPPIKAIPKIDDHSPSSSIIDL